MAKTNLDGTYEFAETEVDIWSHDVPSYYRYEVAKFRSERTMPPFTNPRHQNF